MKKLFQFFFNYSFLLVLSQETGQAQTLAVLPIHSIQVLSSLYKFLETGGIKSGAVSCLVLSLPQHGTIPC